MEELDNSIIRPPIAIGATMEEWKIWSETYPRFRRGEVFLKV